MVASAEKGIVSKVKGMTAKLIVPAVSGNTETDWASPTGQGYLPPKVGDQVWVVYDHGDVAKPLYFPNTDIVFPKGVIAGMWSNASATLATVPQLGGSVNATGTGIDFILPANRWGRASGSIYITGSNNNAFISIKTGAGTLVFDTKLVLNIDQRAYITYTFKGPVSANWAINITNNNTSGGNIVAGSDSTHPVWFTIEDLGSV